MSLTRRDLLKYASVAAVGAAGVTTATITGPADARAKKKASGAKFPGHKPGHIYLGVSAAGSIQQAISRTGPVGLARTYYKWNDGSREDKNIRADHAAGRLPWISFKPASTGRGGWAAIASGRYDSELRARARRYAKFSKPIIVTFNHEPHNDKTGSASDFARAWTRVHDVMKNETGLKNVISVPILGDWEFNPVNRKGDPGAFLPSSVLSRCHFLGVDLYQNKSGQGYDVRLGRIISWLNARGHSDLMVGLGETACTDDYRNPSGAAWWTKSWSWAAAHSDRVAAIAYFNSQHNNNSGNTWVLTESASKLSAFKKSLASSTACKL
jgi:hypothetical protein